MSVRRLALALVLAAGAAAAEPTGPRLGAAANFSQGWRPDLMAAARELGVGDLRDSVPWALVETEPGRFDFESPRAAWPDAAAAAGMTASVTLAAGHPFHDGGDTPHSPEALAAFGAFAAAVAARFPGAGALEIGNEANGDAFVRGPLRAMPMPDRAAAYVALLRAAQAARAGRPDLRILGGAAHSLPAGWLWAVMDEGGAGLIDALAVHPYTTAPEQLARQVAVLRRHPALATLPLEVTEFGLADPARAPGFLLRATCAMALSGVTRAVWYPLHDRGDGFAPLVGPDGAATAVGEAFRLARARMEGRPVGAVRPDPFTYGCRFGGDTLLLWGEPRSVALGPGVTALDARGRPATAPLALAADAPLVLVRKGGLGLGDGVSLGPQRVLADSFHEFAYPGGTDPAPGGLRRVARSGGAELPLVTRPGQERPGVPWTPYLGVEGGGGARLTADTVLPGRRDGAPVEIVHAWTAPEAGPVALRIALRPPARSEDGLSLTVTVDGAVVHAAAGRGPLDATVPLDLARGARVEVAVGPNGTPRGDLAPFRLTILRR